LLLISIFARNHRRVVVGVAFGGVTPGLAQAHQRDAVFQFAVAGERSKALEEGCERRTLLISPVAEILDQPLESNAPLVRSQGSHGSSLGSASFADESVGMGWTGAEAWIFVSIGDASREGPAPLWKVIADADMNNHSIPNVDEFEQAVGQLLGAGLVRIEGELFALTESGSALFAKINDPKRGHIQRFIETVKEWREAAPSDAAPVTWSIGPEVFKAAFQQYHEWFWETYRKVDRDAPRP
jgi:hypothetical protein